MLTVFKAKEIEEFSIHGMQNFFINKNLTQKFKPILDEKTISEGTRLQICEQFWGGAEFENDFQ